MQLIISKLAEVHHGFSLATKDGDNTRTLAVINGGLPKHQGPIVVLSLDQHVIYGVSHPHVVSRLLADGPQTLLTSKELADRLYENGMKASLYRIKVGSTTLYTKLDSFYRVEPQTKYLTIVPGATSHQVGCLIQIQGAEVLLAHDGFKPQVSLKTSVIRRSVDQIQNYVSIDLNKNEP